MKIWKQGIIGIIAIIGLAFVFIACDNDNGDNLTTLTINGLPPSETAYGLYIFPSGADISTTQAVQDLLNARSWEACGFPDSGNVFTLYAYIGGDRYSEPWTKSGNFPVQLLNNPNSPRYATVSFSNGYGTTQFSSFTLQQ
jgi:hypothetical protein